METTSGALRSLLEEAARVGISLGMTDGQFQAEAERHWTVAQLRRFRGNQSRTAAALRTHRNTLSRRMGRLGIRLDAVRPPTRRAPNRHLISTGG